MINKTLTKQTYYIGYNTADGEKVKSNKITFKKVKPDVILESIYSFVTDYSLALESTANLNFSVTENYNITAD